MAVALRELHHGQRRPRLRVLPAPAPTPPHVFWLRRALALLAAIGLVIAMVGAAGAIRSVTAPAEPTARTNLTVVIAPGQTLWDIAARYAPADRDVTGFAAEIAELNDVDALSVQPGTPLVVPLETAVVTATPER
jgi:hypothetical protein